MRPVDRRSEMLTSLRGTRDLKEFTKHWDILLQIGETTWEALLFNST